MKKILKTILVAGAMSVIAFGQGYSNPVREMEKPGRSAVFGVCTLQLEIGYSGNQVECLLSENDQPLGSTIPAGKVLVVEDIAASCIKNASDTLAGMRLISGPYYKLLPAQLDTTYPGNQQIWVSSMPMRTYARAGSKIYFSSGTVTNATHQVSCTARFAGHFESLQ